MAGKIVAITGIRDLAEQDLDTVEIAMLELFHAREIRFGGARGSDTWALRIAYELGIGERLVVIVPFCVADQPREAQKVIQQCADEVIEMRLPWGKRAYFERNDALIDGADLVVGFTDGRESGGTYYTMSAAAKRGIAVEVVRVGAEAKMRPNAPPHFREPAPTGSIYVMRPYVSKLTQGVTERWSQAVRNWKEGLYDEHELDAIADEVADYIQSQAELRGRPLVPMPRQAPQQESDLIPLLERVSERCGVPLLRGWLVRHRKPDASKGRKFARRQRFPAEEHAETMRVVGGREITDVLIVDNVVTTKATMSGAQAAVLRDTGVAPVGLGLLYSFKLEEELAED